ncbi:MAG: S-layer homology domain-containing protein [Defluviitaleaceae bacterium]|nr:S-layer homology domain-containing protein [Defluviitaleaceae bacterium]MCL2264267.1 S-layer homology domain-containing protein [Defluviitaleaceae bacterium]
MKNYFSYFAAVVIAFAIFVPVGVFANETEIPSPNFSAVTSINLSTTTGQMETPFNLNEHATLFPSRTGEQYPVISNINWEVVSSTPEWGSTISATVSGAVLSTTGEGQGTVRVRATVPRGRQNRTDFVQYFNLTFTSQAVIAELEGLYSLYAGVAAEGRVTFTLDGGGRFVPEIFPQDFFVRGLPNGLFAEEAERISDTLVEVRISGTPNVSMTGTRDLNVPTSIAPRNVRQAIVRIPVVREWMSFEGVTESAIARQGTITFDLNRYSLQHTDRNVSINPRDHEFRRISFGGAVLREDRDYIRTGESTFTIQTEFLQRLPIGRWDLTFHMNRGANPTITMNIIDTSLDIDAPQELTPGPAAAPPTTPLHPNENFIHLSGGTSVAVNDLRWDLNRARVAPVVQGNAATVTVRAHVLDHLSWNMPGRSFDVVTPMARLRVPVNLLCLIFDGRFAIVNRDLGYNEVDVRITLTDVSGNEHLNAMFNAFHPNGDILAPLVDLRIELIRVSNGEVILTAQELTSPIDMTFVVMNNATHLRPAGTFFQDSWLEFVPYRSFTPNEVTTRSIFLGAQTIIHNRVHFEDVYSMHWGFAQSYTAAYSGLLFPVAELHPNAPITRGEFAQLLASALQLPRAGANRSGHVDVLPPSVFFDGVSRLFEAGLLGEQIPGAAFMPNQVISREEIAAIIGMAINWGEPVRQPQPRPITDAFTDIARFAPQHLAPVQQTVNHGIMGGFPDNTFRPQDPASRIHALEAVVGVTRLLGLID